MASILSSNVARVVGGFIALQVILVTWMANGAFSDEGTYVLAGTSILRNQDHMVGYPLWLDGSPYVFPLLSGAAYLAAGLEGSRLLTVLLYAVGVVFFARFVELCFDSRTKFWATLAFCGSGPFIAYAHLAVYDSLAFACVMACAWCIQESARTEATKWIIFAAAFAALATLAKYSIVVLLVGCIPIAIVGKGRPPWTRILVTVILAGAFAAMFLRLVHGHFVPPQVLGTLMGHSRTLGRANIAFAILFVMAAPLCMALLAFRYLPPSKRRLAWALVGAGLLWPLLHMFTQQVVSVQKHATLSTAFLYPLVGVVLAHLWTQRRKLAIAVLAGLTCIAAVQSHVMDHSWPDIRPVARYLMPKLRSSDTVAISTGWDFAMYAVTEGKFATPRSVMDGWRISNGDDICSNTWIVGRRPDSRYSYIPGLIQYAEMDHFARGAQHCGFELITSFSAPYYFVWPPLFGRSPIELALYRNPRGR